MLLLGNTTHLLARPVKVQYSALGAAAAAAAAAAAVAVGLRCMMVSNGSEHSLKQQCARRQEGAGS
jgi:hypothetical protein